MFGPPSSPPASYMTHKEEVELQQSLLPAFGHESISGKTAPREFTRPKFSIYRDDEKSEAHSPPRFNFLPTPLPTSEANQASSPIPSSPQRSLEMLSTDQAFSDPPVGSFDTPLQQLIIARVPLSGEKVTIGRSSKSSKVALKPVNRLASRVHAKVNFDSEDNLVKIECLGWNGLNVNVPQEVGSRKTFPVSHQQVLNIERTEGITLDIHGDKVLVELVNDLNSDVTEDELWPTEADHTETSAPPKKRLRIAAPEDMENKENVYPLMHEKLKSKKSEKNDDQMEQEPKSEKSKSEKETTTNENDEEDNINGPKKDAEVDEKVTSKILPEEESKATAVEVENKELTNKDANEVDSTPNENKTEEAPSNSETQSNPSRMETPEPDATQHINTLSSNHIDDADSRASSVEPNSSDPKRKSRRQHEDLTPEKKQELQNVMANFIAFSRMSAVPFSSIRKANSTLQALPKSQVREIIGEVPWIGIITGSVEDTTGRKSEDTYYYMPERDVNDERKQIVQNTKGHRSLRNCRKTPKQYFYRPLNLD